MSKKIIRVKDLPLEGIKKGQMFEIESNDVAYLTHNIHKYPAKFIPHIPRWAIKLYLTGKNRLVLDPFCGSGTTCVEAIVNGHNSLGIDIDPLSCLISKVKTTPLEKKILENRIRELKEKIKRKKKGEFKPKIHNLYHWFTPENVEKLSIIRDCIEEYKEEKDIYDFLIITFSSIIRKVSNADDQSQKTYVSHTNPKAPAEPFKTFFNRLDIYAERVAELNELINSNNEAKILLGDSRALSGYLKNMKCDKADLAVTSPPYIKAIDYIYNQMAEYFWIGDLFGLENQKKQNNYKQKYIGTKMVFSNEYKVVPQTNLKKIDFIVNKIKKKDVKHAYITAKFFVDIRDHLDEMYSVLRKGGHYIFVIGNNYVSGYYVPSHLLVIECAEKLGFRLENYFGYVIRNRYMRFPRMGRGGIIAEDWVIDIAK
jgi:DNA modification methylase